MNVCVTACLRARVCVCVRVCVCACVSGYGEVDKFVLIVTYFEYLYQETQTLYTEKKNIAK